MQFLNIKNNTKYPFNSKCYEDPNNFKLISYEKEIITLVTNNSKVYNFYLDSGLALFSNDINPFEFEELNFNFGNVIYLKNLTNAAIIVNDNYNVYEVNQNVYSEKFLSVTEINLKVNEIIKLIRGTADKMFFVMNNNIIYEFDKINNNKQTLTTFPQKIKDLQCGTARSILLLQNGEIYGMGDNKNGQLGIFEKDTNNFTLITLPFKVKKISCYQKGTLLLNNFNELYGTGDNFRGELGLGHVNSVKTFTKIVINNMNDKIVNIFGCPNVNCNIILTEKKELFMTGNPLTYRGNGLLKNNETIKSYNFTVHYLDTFTKIKDFEITKKYLYPLIWSRDLFVVMTDFKLIDFEQSDNEDDYLQNNLYLKLLHYQISDIVIII
ncbi:hypothetical protein ABK040_000578 [Willaertia magna]